MDKDRTHRLLSYVFENAERNDPGSVIRAIDGFSRRQGGMIHLGREKGEIFDRIVQRTGAARVLECGTNYGYSALRLALNLGSPASICTIEANAGLAETARALIVYSGLADRVEVICGKAGDVVGRFSEPFDLIFIDHLPQNYYADLKAIERLGLLKEGSVVISDNVVIFEHQLGPYLEHLRASGAYRSTLHRPSPDADGIEVSVRQQVAA